MYILRSRIMGLTIMGLARAVSCVFVRFSWELGLPVWSYSSCLEWAANDGSQTHVLSCWGIVHHSALNLWYWLPVDWPL